MINTIVSILDYFFNFAPDSTFPLQWIPWTLAALAVITAIIVFVKARTCKDSILRKILQEYPGKFLTIDFLLAINLLSRTYRVEVLSMRIFTYVLVAWVLFSFYTLIHDLRVTYPNRKHQVTPKFQRLEEKYHIHKNKRPKTVRRRPSTH